MQTFKAYISVILGLSIGVAASLAILKHAPSLLVASCVAFCVLAPFAFGRFAVLYIFEREGS